MSDNTTTPETHVVDLDNVLRLEAVTILDFGCGSIFQMHKSPVLSTWPVGGTPESCSDMFAGTTIIALAIHQLLVEHGCQPFATIDGTRLVLQALCQPVLDTNNLLAVGLPNSPDLDEIKERLTPALIRATVLPLAPVIAKSFEDAWLNQYNNPQNPISQIVNAARLIYTILVMLNHSTSGNLAAGTHLHKLMHELHHMAGTIKTNSDLRSVLIGLLEMLCELLGIQQEALSDTPAT